MLVFVRLVLFLVVLVLDYLSLSSVVHTPEEGGNEYIQAAPTGLAQFASEEPYALPHEVLPQKTVRWVFPSPPQNNTPCGTSERPFQTGTASWYGPGFQGKEMANGAPYNMHAATIAHKELPLGTRVCIRNPANERVVIATVTDRGPFVGNRIADLSKRVASTLGITGLGRVELYIL